MAEQQGAYPSPDSSYEIVVATEENERRWVLGPVNEY